MPLLTELYLPVNTSNQHERCDIHIEYYFRRSPASHLRYIFAKHKLNSIFYTIVPV